ncbi:MAG: hypothetical protein JSU96_07370 [Acidobacteriota bacterium]|nr:MAG: hypothetical protein JSU96_07370 [Acidobacteriota bacterium]
MKHHDLRSWSSGENQSAGSLQRLTKVRSNPLEKFRQGVPLTEEESFMIDEYWTAHVSNLAAMFVPREG